MDTTESRVRKALAEFFDHIGCEPQAPEHLDPEASFVRDYGFDSLDSLEALMALEDEFEIEIPDEMADGVETIGDAIAMIRKHLEPANG